MMSTRYICDPSRNTACSNRKLCFEQGGPCGLTDDARYAVRNIYGEPVRAVDPMTIPLEENDERKTESNGH